MSKPFRLVVAGGRQFSDEAYLADAIERSLGDYAPAELLRSITPEGYGHLQIVSGAAAGADRLGEQWAAARGVPVQQYPARWDALDTPGAVVRTARDGRQYNARAGFDRNVLMAQNADAVLVMPGGKGTDHMVQTALAHGLPVWDARAGDAEAVVLLEPPRRADAVAPRPDAAAASGKPAAVDGSGVVIRNGLIEALGPDDVFVFGSNQAGRHGLGAALTARRRFGAEYGVGEGLTGQSYALPTKDAQLRVRPLDQIQQSVQLLGETARQHPGRSFYLTRVGQGLAGLPADQLEAVIRSANLPANVRPYWEWEGGAAQAPSQVAAAAPPPFEIVASRDPDASFDVLGMRERGRVMATIPAEKGGNPRLVGVSAPWEPGWLGNPWIANDAGGPEWMTREKATELFGELVREKAKDAAWRDAFLALEGKRVGYYKPDEAAIHLHEVQRVIPELKQQLEQERMAAAAQAAAEVAAAQAPRVQLELALGGGGGSPPPPRPPVVMMADPSEPQRGPAPQAPAPDDPVVIAVQEDPKRKAGDLLPWLLAAGGGAAAGGGLAYLMQQGQAPQGGSG